MKLDVFNRFNHALWLCTILLKMERCSYQTLKTSTHICQDKIQTSKIPADTNESRDTDLHTGEPGIRPLPHTSRSSTATFMWRTTCGLISRSGLCSLNSKGKKKPTKQKKAKKSHTLIIPATDFLLRPVAYLKTNNSHVPKAHAETSNAACHYTLVQ